MLPINRFTGPVNSVGGVTVNAVNFNGTSTYLTRGADLTGNVDGKAGTISVWLKDADITATQYILANTGEFLLVNILASLVQIVGKNTGGSAILDLRTSASSISNDTWFHLLASWDLANAANKYVYITDVDRTNSLTHTNDTIDYTRADWSVGENTGGTGVKFSGDMAELWFDDQFIDLSTEANRRKFIDAGGKPVDLGADGSTPTGSAPLIFQSGDTDSWHTNLGTGEGFTENGALTTASTSPSD